MQLFGTRTERGVIRAILPWDDFFEGEARPGEYILAIEMTAGTQTGQVIYRESWSVVNKSEEGRQSWSQTPNRTRIGRPATRERWTTKRISIELHDEEWEWLDRRSQANGSAEHGEFIQQLIRDERDRAPDSIRASNTIEHSDR